MDLIIDTKRICLQSKFLNQNFIDHLFAKLSALSEEECTKEHGYIIKVNRIIEIIDHEIGRANSDNVFLVKYEASTLKPEPGKKMKGKVCMIYKDGIFIIIMSKQKMLIPKSYLTGYKFNEIDCCYENDTNVIRKDDEIFATVIATKYNKQTFSCFGSLA